MTIRVYVYDSRGALVNDPDRSMENFAGITFSTMWPKGYTTMSATVGRDVFAPWMIKTGNRIVIREGQKSVYDGRLCAPALTYGDSSQVRITAQGWYIILQERSIRKRWVDQKAISRLRWGDGRDQHEDQTSPIVEKRDADQFLRVSIRPKDMTIGTTNYYEERYDSPSGNIHKVDYDYAYRTGEGFDLLLVGDGLEDTEHVLSTTHASGAVAHTFTTTTATFFLRVQPYTSTLYDQNDWASFTNMVVYMEYDPAHSVSTPTYTIDEIIEDVIVLARGSELSADVSQIGGSTTVLDNFITRDDSYQRAAEIIADLAAFSDASQNTYGLAVWDGDGSSDGLPQVYFAARTITEYEYVVNGNDEFIAEYRIEYSDSELYNWVPVKWENERGQTEYLDPNDDADLKDTDSITTYGERHAPLQDAGEATQADAKQLAQRYLAYHKDPLFKGNISVIGRIRRRGGVMAPAAHVRAGQRIYLQDLDQVIFIRETQYDVDSDTVRIIPDIPADDITH